MERSAFRNTSRKLMPPSLPPFTRPYSSPPSIAAGGLDVPAAGGAHLEGDLHQDRAQSPARHAAVPPDGLPARTGAPTLPRAAHAAVRQFPGREHQSIIGRDHLGSIAIHRCIALHYRERRTLVVYPKAAPSPVLSAVLGCAKGCAALSIALTLTHPHSCGAGAAWGVIAVRRWVWVGMDGWMDGWIADRRCASATRRLSTRRTYAPSASPSSARPPTSAPRARHHVLWSMPPCLTAPHSPA